VSFNFACEIGYLARSVQKLYINNSQQFDNFICISVLQPDYTLHIPYIRSVVSVSTGFKNDSNGTLPHKTCQKQLG